MPEQRYVIFRDDYGVYLGSCLGMGFWSKLDPAGQVAACTVTEEEFGKKKELVDDPETFESSRIVPVTPSDGNYATITDCIAAGLPGWDPNSKGDEGLNS